MRSSTIGTAILLCLLCTFISGRAYFKRNSRGGSTPNSFQSHLKLSHVVGVTLPGNGTYGFVTINSNGDDLFYMLFPPKNQSPSAPLLIWLSGGPGCASIMALIWENGPYQVSNGAAVDNPYSWNENAHLMFIDHPIQTGFSHGKLDDLAQTTQDIQAMFLQFMIGFRQLHPEFATKDLYLSGESYAGHYLPVISNKLFFYQDNYFNLKGVAIGNGWTTPAAVEGSYVPFSLENQLITQEVADSLAPQFRICQALQKNDPLHYKAYSTNFCDNLSDAILVNPETEWPNFNMYDIRKPCINDGCYDLSAQYAFLSNPAVWAALGVDKPYDDCNGDVYGTLMRLDGRVDVAPYLVPLLNANIKVLAYNGDKDWICNWRSGQAWTAGVQWNNQAQFNAVTPVEYLMQGNSIGQMQNYGNFSFLRVYNAGHMVPTDQPQAALFMMNNFMGFTS